MDCAQTMDTKGRLGDLTPDDAFVVVANALLYAAQPLKQATSLLIPKSDGGPKFAELNSLLCVSTVMLLSSLDWIASLIERCIPTSDERIKVYFASYPFLQSGYTWIRSHQKTILDMSFDGMSFNDFTNFVKHEQPYIGLPSLVTQTNLYDVVDRDGIQYVYGILIPAINQAIKIVKHVGATLAQPVPQYPAF